jgi:hypothetical protein
MLLGQSKIGFNPSYRTNNYAPDRKAKIVLLPTPVSPITMTASLQLGSFGILAIPFLIISFSF